MSSSGSGGGSSRAGHGEAAGVAQLMSLCVHIPAGEEKLLL